MNKDSTAYYQETPEPLYFDEEKLESYRRSKEFNYFESDSESWWTSFKKWLHDVWLWFWDGIFGNLGLNMPGWLLELAKYVVLLLLILLIIWLVVRINPGELFLKDKKQPAVLLSEEENIIQNEDISELIQHAVQEKDYRLAIRYYYLLILKQLRENKLIDYRAEKTNGEYFNEIRQKPIRGQFERITRLYEFIWYGYFSIDQKQFMQFSGEFKEMENRIIQENNA